MTEPAADSGETTTATTTEDTTTTTTTTETTTTETTTTTTTTGGEGEEKKEQFSFLLLGGTGFIGRNMVEYLVNEGLASNIVVADKSMPATSYLNTTHKALFKDHVTFKQSDLSKDAHVTRVFKGQKFDYVINMCGETRFGLTEHDYKIRCQMPAEKCSVASLEHGVKKYVEVSTAQVYQAGKSKTDEDGKIDPWTMQATYRYAAEEKVKEVSGLPWVILRPAICYGLGDLTGLSPRITCAAVYKQTKEKMQFLWNESLGMNVVHVRDVCEALWIACSELEAESTYNVAEPSDVNQGQLNAVLGEIFGIQTGFHGSVKSTLAKTMLSTVADTANDMHVPEWTRMCQAAGINNTPLTPYIDKELLYCNHLRINGEKIVADSSYTYKCEFSKDSVKEQIVDFIDHKIFPPVELA